MKNIFRNTSLILKRKKVFFQPSIFTFHDTLAPLPMLYMTSTYDLCSCELEHNAYSDGMESNSSMNWITQLLI